MCPCACHASSPGSIPDGDFPLVHSAFFLYGEMVENIPLTSAPCNLWSWCRIDFIFSANLSQELFYMIQLFLTLPDIGIARSCISCNPEKVYPKGTIVPLGYVTTTKHLVSMLSFVGKMMKIRKMARRTLSILEGLSVWNIITHIKLTFDLILLTTYA